MHLTGAFRSLPRPSSPLSAKASTIRPCFALKFFKDRCNSSLQVTAGNRTFKVITGSKTRPGAFFFARNHGCSAYCCASGYLTLLYCTTDSGFCFTATRFASGNMRYVTGATHRNTKALLFYPVCQRTKEMRFTAAGERP
jgi:hypothetical protein